MGVKITKFAGMKKQKNALSSRIEARLAGERDRQDQRIRL